MGGPCGKSHNCWRHFLKSAGIKADPVAISRMVFFDEKLGTFQILKILQSELK